MGGSAPPVVEGRQEGSLCGTELLRGACTASRGVTLETGGRKRDGQVSMETRAAGL